MGIREPELKKLFAKSGNMCAFPDCCLPLVVEVDGHEVVLGEIAHIVAEQPTGPRGASPLTAEERNRYENLMLACSRHHQLVDAPPMLGYYTVERLHQIKLDHEQDVERRLRGRLDIPRSTPMQQDRVHSSLLQVERMPCWIFSAPFEGTRQDVIERLQPARDGGFTPFILREGRLIAFQNLADYDSPFAVAADPGSSRTFRISEWVADPDRTWWVVDLLNRALSGIAGRRGLRFDRHHRRFYFPQLEEGAEREVRYRPLNLRSSSRKVVWQPRRRATGQPHPYWLHRAVSLAFLQVSAQAWALSVRPALHATSDGSTPLEPTKVGPRVTRTKARWFNYDLLGEVNFWRDYLGDSKSRIVASFGSHQQTLVISTHLLSCEVEWPGIPAEHDKPFKNVEYVDDRSAWAELPDSAYEEDEEQDDDLDQQLDDSDDNVAGAG